MGQKVAKGCASTEIALSFGAQGSIALSYCENDVRSTKFRPKVEMSVVTPRLSDCIERCPYQFTKSFIFIVTDHSTCLSKRTVPRLDIANLILSQRDV